MIIGKNVSKGLVTPFNHHHHHHKMIARRDNPSLLQQP
jgi:hypothetical protein